jgi:hypothetical protein
MFFIVLIQSVMAFAEIAFAKKKFKKAFEPTPTVMNEVQLELLSQNGTNR